MSKSAGEKRSFSNGRVRIERLVSLKQGKEYSSKQWFYRTNINRTTHRFPLGGNLEKALKTATTIKAAIQSGQVTVDALLTQYRPGTKLKPKAVQATPQKTVLTIEDILNAHAANEKVLALQPRSAQGYRRSLLRVAYFGQLHLENKYAPLGRLNAKQIKIAEQMPVSILTRQLARAYLHSAIEEIEDLDQLESVKRTANSTLGQAKSVFSLEAMELYEDALNLPLPDLSPFRSKKSLPVETVKYTLPATEIVIKLFDFYQALSINSPIWIAMTLALYGGLRRSEVIAARRAWFSDAQGEQINIRTESNFKPKGKKSRSVPIRKDLYAILTDRQNGSEAVFLLGENEAAREAVIDDLNTQLRVIFNGVQKPFHELRKLYGCWIASSTGIREAQRRLGHVSIETTEKHYADINMASDLSELWAQESNQPIK